MTARHLSHVLFGCVLGLAVAPARSQTLMQASVGPAGGNALYRLDEGSTFQRGCFDPCMCPIMEERAVMGTFRLGEGSFDGLYTRYPITDVNWRVDLFDSELRISGSGEYRIGGEAALLQQLTLDLQVGNEPVAHFDSGLTPGGGDFPRIEMAVSINGMFCFDTVIRVNAAPVPRRDIRRYRVLVDSMQQEGCWEPCDCPMRQPLPLSGSFSLVPLTNGPLFAEYAVTDVNWTVHLPAAPTPGPAPGPLANYRGSGFYRIGGEVAQQQRMTVYLRRDGGSPLRFDSGLVVGGGGFPRIDILMSINGMYCYDQVIDLHAAPLSATSP